MDLDVEVHRIKTGCDERAHRLPGVAVFCAPQRAVGFLPVAFADIIAQRVTEDARQRVVFAQVFRSLPYHRHQLALELHHVRGIGGNHDGFIGGAQRVERAVTDVGLFRILGRHALALGTPFDMRGVVQAGAVEIARFAGDQGFEGGQQVAGGGGLVAGER